MRAPEPRTRRPAALALVLGVLAGLFALGATTWTGGPAAAAPVLGGDPVAYTYLSTGATATAYAIDTVTGNTLAQFPLTDIPGAIAITPDSRYVLIGETPSAQLGAFHFPGQAATGGYLQVIDTANNTLVNVTATVGANPIAIAITPDGSMAYIASGPSAVSSGTVAAVKIGPGPTFTPEPQLSLQSSSPPDDVAVTPDGKTLLVVTVPTVFAYSLPGLTLSGSLAFTPASTGAAPQIVVSPTGTTAYLTAGTVGGASEILPIALPGLTAGTPITLPATANPSNLTLAVTASGQQTLYMNDSGATQVNAVDLHASPPAASTLVTTGVDVNAVAPSPDGTVIEAGTSSGHTYPITSAGSPPGTLGPCMAANTCPPGGGPLVVTPDQAPVAAFSATSGVPGTATTFDASSSTVAYGSITGYHWDFGDATTQDTSSPTTSHTYTKAGTYSVVLTETDSAGTSVSTSPPSTIFTGKTMGRRGAPSAQVSHKVTISTTPASPGPSPVPTTTASPLPSPPPGFSPKITLSPPVGPPGTVVAVDGTGFPPSSAVVLAWKPGIGRTAVTTDAHGTFTARQVLVFPKDQLGPRTLTADPFPTATAGFLVVPPPLAPGGDDQGPLLQLLYRG